MNRSAKQVSISGLTDFPKEMNKLKMNLYMEHEKVHAKRKILRKCKG